MKFWRGNRIANEFDMPVSEVADQFITWFRSEPGSGDVGRDMLPVERLLRWWLTSSEHFNSVWKTEVGDDSFAELLDLVIGLVYGRGEPDNSVNHI